MPTHPTPPTRITFFERLVYNIVKHIPPGKVTTYGEIARALGDVRAARAVGEALSGNPFPESVPCHRVVMSDGSLGGYAFGGPAEKRRKLEEEGVRFEDGKVVQEAIIRAEELRRYAFPLFERMREAQRKLAELAVFEGRVGAERACGVDVAYVGKMGVAAAVVMSVDGEVEHVEIASAFVEIPYVPTYLAFREMPPVYLAVERAREVVDFDVLLVDGQGLIHPRGAGEAVHFGVVLDTPAVGVAKRYLTGEVVGNEVYVGGRLAGYVERGVYVSPGHMVSPEAALEVARAFWRSGRQPEPLLQAHRHATAAARRLKRDGQRTLEDLFR